MLRGSDQRQLDCSKQVILGHRTAFILLKDMELDLGRWVIDITARVRAHTHTDGLQGEECRKLLSS